MPRPDPFRLRVQKAVCETIKTVTPANGYVNDLSDYVEDEVTREHVFRGKEDFDDESDPRPLVAVVEDPQNSSDLLHPGVSGGDSSGRWRLIVQGFVVDQLNHPTDIAYELCAEVIQALVGARKKYDVLGLGNMQPCVTDMQIGTPVVRPASRDGDVVIDCAWFAFPLILNLNEDLENPFAES